MRKYKNQVLPGENAVAAGNVFCSYLQRALKKLDDLTPKAFKACFEVLNKLYDNLKADYEVTIGNKKHNLIFFDTFSSKHQNIFVQQQKEFHKMTIDKLSTSSRSFTPQTNCYVSNVNVRLQHGQKNNPSSTNNDQSNKCGHI